MKIRKYITDDCVKLAEMFFETVHTINASDYSKEQLYAWANGEIDIDAWNESFLKNNTFIVEINNVIVGFGDMDNTGYLDRLYVHKDYQRQGVASTIVRELEYTASQQGVLVFTTHASITAKPFFEKQGYNIVSDNKVIRHNVELANYIMQKYI